MLNRYGGGRGTSDEMVANVQAAYERSPRKSFKRASRNFKYRNPHRNELPNTFKKVRTTLDKIFSSCWIVRGGPIAYHPKTPDLTPLDFYLWGYVKDKVYVTPIRDLHDLRDRIIETIKSISEDMLQRTCQETVNRLTSSQ
ncbi:hypothetical protein L9F63_000728 [Diploptera punctata]|uniref:Uncharacterized protein n=1 Tax=Diploptera punctata TaxID=6984 RepID=A0AAD8AL35_DIPPU|nr:hypothetical protein L9F63_000728 [Diploptera punctata]